MNLREQTDLPPRWQALVDAGVSWHSQRRPASVLDVIRATAAVVGIPHERITGHERIPALVAARCLCMYLARSRLHVSYERIARMHGGRHHTTVIIAVRKIERQCNEPAIAALIEKILARLAERFDIPPEKVATF
jgi:chromosomal replication initiation ATPase DnaA